jgi:hypothetical protein
LSARACTRFLTRSLLREKTHVPARAPARKARAGTRTQNGRHLTRIAYDNTRERLRLGGEARNPLSFALIFPCPLFPGREPGLYRWYFPEGVRPRKTPVSGLEKPSAGFLWPDTFLRETDFLTSPENVLAHFQIVARASCPCYLEIFHGRDAHATKNVPSHFPENSPICLSRSGSSMA